MLMPVTRMGSRTKLKTTKHVTTKTAMRIKVFLGFRPITMMRARPGRGLEVAVGFGAVMRRKFRVFQKSRN
jgi:hypothetical protein